uniref:Uncharacterized protein n=1 Tax=Anguilla anguilla TaxID=7936 RepID=A0A0E9UYS9_ANGAN
MTHLLVERSHHGRVLQ